MSGAGTEGATTGGQARVVAVLATVSGTGCTSTVANVAFLLARAGRRVLVIDLSSDGARIREYLEPFRVGTVALPDRIGRGLAMVPGVRQAPDADRSPVANRFTFPEATGLVDVAAPAYPNGTASSWPPGAVANLRRELPGGGYDDVLIDAPTGPRDESLKVIAALSDVAFVCFQPRPRAIGDAAELAGRLRRAAPIGIGLVPVATEFDHRYQPRVERGRDEIQAAFADLLADQRQRGLGGGAVEIPRRADDTFDPLLSVLVEEPSPDNRLRAGYGRLAVAAAGGAISEPAPESAAFRARYRRAFGLDSDLKPDRILIACAAPDRPWADWVRARLERSGAQTRPLRQGREWLAERPMPGLVVIDSEHLEDSPERASVEQAIAGAPLEVFRVLVGRRATAPEPDGAWAEVTAGSERRLVTALLGHFGLVERPRAEPEKGARLPGDRPDVFNAPPRNPRFVGRDEDIEQLRDRLVEGGDGPATVTLTGAPGVGKSELALEYAYRFAGDYDLIWWVPAGDEQSAMVSLAGLAARLDLPGSHDYGTTAALERLAADRAYGRFLLVYDNVADRAGLDNLLPSGHQGHVIITSSEGKPGKIELAVMTPSDSSRLLTSRVPELSREDAGRVAAAAGQLPLALELAGTWLAETTEHARRVEPSAADAAGRAVRTFFERRGGEPGPDGVVSRVVAVVADSLAATPVGRVAVLLAQMCSFLSPDGISLDLVRSRSMLERLLADGGEDAGPLRLDAGEIDRVLWTGARYGLFHVAWGRENALRVHRVVQAALRDGMAPERRAARRLAMLASLAAFAPSEVEQPTPRYLARFTELQRHVFPSGATDSDDDRVRRWLVNQVRFLVSQGGHGVHKAAVGHTQKLLDVWTSRYGADDPLRLRLARELANLHRSLGEFDRAFRLDDAALAVQRGSLELNHPQTLMSARGRGGDLRGLGLFAEAVAEDRATWEGLREAFGEDHPQARMAAHNLASAMYLSGDVVGALTLAEGNYHQLLRLLGEDDIRTWSPLVQVGVYRRELGEFDAARNALREVAQRVRRLRPELNTFGASVRWQQAIVLRCEGSAASAKQRTGEALGAFRELLGDDHPNTLACKLSFASAHRAVGGEPAAGIELAESVLDGYLHRARLVAEHPFVALSRLGIGLARSAAGYDGSPETLEAFRLLSDRLGDTHPWALAAAVDHAAALGRAGDAAGAAEVAAEAHTACVEFFGTGHPHTMIAAHNLRLATDRDAAAEEGWKEIDVDVPES